MRGVHAWGVHCTPARSTRCAGGLTPKPPRRNHERGVQVGRVRGDDTVRGSRLRPEDLTTITAPAWGLAYLPPHHQLAASPGCSSSWTRTRCCGPTRAAGGSVTVTVRSLGPHMARERTSKASTGRACLPHCVAHTAAHIAPHEWAKVHTGTRDRGCVTAACGCRDIELSAACTCPCRRSSTARCMAGQPPLLKDSRVRGMCARDRTSNWLSVPEHTRLKRAAGRVRSGAGHGRDSRLESVATPPPNPSLGGLCIDTCGCGYRPRARGSRAGGPNHCTPCRPLRAFGGSKPP